MAAQKRGLGRGLDALLGNLDSKGSENKTTEDGQLVQLPVDLVVRGKYQPRREMDPASLQELADSIKAQGVMQPIIVRAIDDSRYEIVAGERRWRATQLAGLADIPAIVKNVSDESAIAMALIENIQRENLNAIDEAAALHRLQEEFGLTQQQTADAVGKSRTAVANLIRLLGLNDEVQALLSEGALDMGHARALLALVDSEQTLAAKTVVSKQLSVRQTEALVRKILASDGLEKEVAKVDPDIKHLEHKLSDQLGSSVTIQHGSKGKGKLVINYGSTQELEGILSHIK
ncbi:MAG: ParB/RepB/Spo0J family partition protein [Pseudomonadales bacterium]